MHWKYLDGNKIQMLGYYNMFLFYYISIFILYVTVDSLTLSRPDFFATSVAWEWRRSRGRGGQLGVKFVVMETSNSIDTDVRHQTVPTFWRSHKVCKVSNTITQPCFKVHLTPIFFISLNECAS